MIDQHRWNEKGAEALTADVSTWIIKEPQLAKKSADAHNYAMRILPPLAGLRVLDIGCGRGEMAIWLAQQGAIVTGIDLGDKLIDAARKRAEFNRVDVRFEVGSCAELPFDDGSFDAVIGVAILHHLTPQLLVSTLEETCRVLRPGRIAIYHEPVENSAAFDWLQNMVPRHSPGNPQYRPAIWQRAAWQDHVTQQDDRALTNDELRRAGVAFAAVDIIPFRMLARLSSIVGMAGLWRNLDRWLLRVPFLRRYSQTVLAIYRK